MTNHDPIDRPSHYAEGRSYEPIDVIADWELNYHLGNVLKYISRAGRKQNHLEDLKKARWYLSREIETLEQPVPFAATYEDVLEDQILSALEGNDPFDVDDQPLPGWDSDEDYMWDPSLGPVELSQEEVDMILRNRDISNSDPDEIVKVIEKRGFLLGVKANGNTCVLGSNGACE
jgi:hypothetical protein